MSSSQVQIKRGDKLPKQITKSTAFTQLFRFAHGDAADPGIGSTPVRQINREGCVEPETKKLLNRSESSSDRTGADQPPKHSGVMGLPSPGRTPGRRARKSKSSEWRWERYSSQRQSSFANRPSLESYRSDKLRQ